jgi:hypothetical protein
MHYIHNIHAIPVKRMEHKGFRKDRRLLTDYKPCGLHKPTKCVLRNIPAHYKTHFAMMISSWKGKQRAKADHSSTKMAY